MPYLMIQTNLPLTKKAERSILKNASQLVGELLEKPESFVMVALQPNTPMVFAGSDEPVAFLWLAASDRTAFELYGGATDAGQELHANFGLKWALIREMRSRGVAEYDMNGLLNDGISQFKRSFADHEDVLVGPLDVPFSVTYPLWVRGVPLAKRALRAVRRG